MELWLALILCVVTGFFTSFLLGFAVVPWLRKLKFGQAILDIGPSWHKKKQGTPTMGGILIIAGFVAAVALVLATDAILGGNLLANGNSRPQDVVYIKIFSGILMAVAFAFIGFIDDYIKVVKKRNLGLTEIQKTIPQVLIIAAYLATLGLSDNTAMFIPLGIVWPAVFKKLNTHGKVIAAGVGVSLAIEILQLPFYDRVTDIDDLILNSLGYLIGYGIFLLVRKLKKK